MKFIVLTIGISIICASAYSQSVVDVDKATSSMSDRVFYTVGGQPFSSTKYIKLTGGSPFFSDTWMKGAIETYDSMQYSNILLRLDLLENSVIYLSPDGQEMVSIAPISKISLRDTGLGKTYLFVHLPAVSGASATVWYQQLAGGKTALYKQYFKDLYETKAYGSSITEQSIRTDERYFVMTKAGMTRIKKLKEFGDLFPSKSQAIIDFIKAKNLNGKKESDFIAVAEYINSQP